jgi:hypothetical protein
MLGTFLCWEMDAGGTDNGILDCDPKAEKGGDLHTGFGAWFCFSGLALRSTATNKVDFSKLFYDQTQIFGFTCPNSC